ncbi:Arm-DNA-bind_3 domain-containing protein [Candidatus Nitrotoga sp. HW29]|uniref:Arm DNA-binding domain-containing protein n=1 Tax=Candidatus Nitrotoga sp. HW29 TaxID=2886963 RepID=UPI001EF28255|nr:Arm DNA-binding domain-containing protein [Candidatus Nitrotoga sp. HW29]CAH1905836.1 Arm-DNA-bind_3 domain-containing protein [Candidatus Nitrotoga sp. HW29]
MDIKAALTELIATQAEVKGKGYKMGDGGGMFLLVMPNGAKYWRVSYRFGGKKKTLALGVYPDVTLEDARIRRDEARKLLADGIDPAEVKQAQKAERLAQKDAQIADEARQIAATRFILDNEGALAFRFGSRYIALTPIETSELRTFLDATRAVTSKDTSCR